MLQLLYGEDDFTIQETVASMKLEVMPPDLRDVNVAELDGAEVGFAELAATSSTVPFLAERRLVVVRGLLARFERRAPSRSRRSAEGAPALGEWSALADYLPTVPETTDLVFVDGRLSGANPMLAAVRKRARVRTFPLPRPAGLTNWIRARAKAEGTEIDTGAVDALVEIIGSDLRVLASEVAKLATYRGGKTVREQDVRELVSYAREASIFQAVDAAMEGRPAVAIRAVHGLLQSGSPPVYILSMLARQVRFLIIAKDLRARRVPAAEHGRRLGLSGYPLRKTLQQADKVGAQRLVDMHRKLLDADLAMKSTGADDELVLEMLIAELTPSAARRT